MKYLANSPHDPYTNQKATIIILETDPIWENAYKNWLAGKNPTDSAEWKKGVYMGFNYK